MKRPLTLLIAAGLVVSPWSLPVNAQIVRPANRPTSRQQATSPRPATPQSTASPGLIYSPSGERAPSFSQMSGATAPGQIDLPAHVQMDYQFSRAFPRGATPDQMTKWGDIPNNPQFVGFHKMTLRELSRSSGQDIAGVPLNEIDLIQGMTVEEVTQLYQGLEDKPLDQAPKILQIAAGITNDPKGTLKQSKGAALTFGQKALIAELAKKPALKGISLERLSKGDWGKILTPGEQGEVAKILTKVNGKIPLEKLFPMTQGVIAGDWESVRKQAQAEATRQGSKVLVKELMKNEKFRKMPLGSLTLEELDLEETLPGLIDQPIATIPKIADKYLSDIPGMSEVPVDQLPFDLKFTPSKDDIVARMDVAYAGPTETPITRVISGGTKNQKFKPEPCLQQRCSHFELDNVDGGGPPSKVSGKSWVAGKDQPTPGGKGLLALVNNGKEPTGIVPWTTAAHVKISLENIKEGGNGEPASAQLWAHFQFCKKVPLLGLQCTPHFIPFPTPFKLKEKSLMLIATSGGLPAYLQNARNQQNFCTPAVANALQANASQGSASPGTASDTAAVSSPSPDQHIAPATSNQADQNLRQYLKRIAAGESTGGTDWRQHPDTGAYGVYQFTPESRATMLQRTGIDPWSKDRATADKAAVFWIQMIGGEQGVDLLGTIQKGDFAKADQILSPKQFTSLPGGPEQSKIWNNPQNLQVYGPNGSAPDGAPTGATGFGPCASTSGFIGPEGDGIATGRLKNPTPGAVITSGYGPRVPPAPGASSFHAAVDLALPLGAPILAADGGVVEYSGVKGGYGNYILINHGNGLATWYAHNNANNVQVGQKVTAGQQIGTVGSTGISTGPHLDFGVVEGYKAGNLYSGQAVNPRKHVRF